MGLFRFTLGFLVLLAMTACSHVSKDDIAVEDWNLVWSDEFEEDGLPDESRWSYDQGWGCESPAGCGWGNDEKQRYTARDERNARVVNGHLIIEAHRVSEEAPQYTSARLVTRNKGHWKYGRIACRAKLPGATGTWPAIWMLPVNNQYGGWPKSGEIDIMEHVGYALDSVFGTVHTQAYNHMIGTQKGGHIYHEGVSDEFHEYMIDWSPDDIVWYMDGQPFFKFEKEDGSAKWPFDQPFYLLANLAVGGNWGGKYGIHADSFPQRLLIDYVRVYQKSEYEDL